MFSLQLIQHSDASSLDLDRVIALKQVAWPYLKDSQMQWMQNNLHPNDIHVFLQKEGQDVAYLNIAWVRVRINGVDTTCAGLGNVCSRITGVGYGKLLITRLMGVLMGGGILFCKDTLVEFYRKCNWELVNPPVGTLPKTLEGVNIMVYNVGNVETIEYNDRNF